MVAAIMACVLVFALAFGGTAVVRRYALRRLIDLPNSRSSHATPTPRGGGIAIAGAHLAAVTIAWALGVLPSSFTLALLLGGLAVVLVGFIDDHRPLPALWRLAIHFAAATWVLVCLGSLPPVQFGSHAVDLGLAGSVLAAVFVVWFLNLFNFMDGIDGIAAVQAITMTAGASGLALLCGSSDEVVLTLLLPACATAGFLLWNWPPARIFMGDAGSGYLGFAISCMAHWTVVERHLSIWVWLILGGVFLADATTTLLVRAATGASPAEAHRSHAYQRLVRSWNSHRRVTLSVATTNVVWLLPLAAVATLSPGLGAVLTVIALLPLFVCAWLLGAGRPGDLGDPWCRWSTTGS
jgi:Fuc2NAc and GlcNAc transferase